MKKRKVNTKNKEELIRSNKNKKRIIIIMMLVIAYFVVSMIWNNVSDIINPEVNGSITSNETLSEEYHIVDYVKGFVYGILSLEYPFLIICSKSYVKYLINFIVPNYEFIQNKI